MNSFRRCSSFYVCTSVSIPIIHGRHLGRAHRVLAEPAVLQLLFYYLPRSSNFRNAVVCHAWSEHATVALWRDASFALFSTLDGVEVDENVMVLYLLP